MIQHTIDARDLLGDAADIGRLCIGLKDALQADSAFDSPHDERREVKIRLRQERIPHFLLDLMRGNLRRRDCLGNQSF